VNDSVHKRIADILREDWPKKVIRFDINPEILPDSALFRLLFQNVRTSDGCIKGLRLTKDGLRLLRTRFQCWAIMMEKGFAPKPNHLLFFDRTCTMPWYLDSYVLILFEPQLAMRAKLVGDIDQLLTAFS
jgi:hypothetical protein